VQTHAKQNCEKKHKNACTVIRQHGGQRKVRNLNSSGATIQWNKYFPKEWTLPRELSKNSWCANANISCTLEDGEISTLIFSCWRICLSTTTAPRTCCDEIINIGQQCLLSEVKEKYYFITVTKNIQQIFFVNYLKINFIFITLQL